MKKFYLYSVIFLLFTGCTPFWETEIPQTMIAEDTPSVRNTAQLITTSLATKILTPTVLIPISSPTSTPTNAPSSTPTPTPSATPTVTSSPTPTATLESVCPGIGSPDALPDFHNSAELQESILTFLNDGGQLIDLPDALDDLTSMEIFYQGIEADLNGDGVLEIIITIDTLDYEEDHSRILVFQCLGREYHPVFVDTGSLFRYLPHPITIVDVNGDSRSEFIIEIEISRSARGWSLAIISWNNGEFVDLLTDTGDIRLGTGIEWELIDLNNDGNQEIILTGHTIFHSEGGYPREVRLTFELSDNGDYQLLATEYLPSEYRHHVLEDAQRALDMGDLHLAETFYKQAARDNMLINIDSYHLGYFDDNTDSPNEYQRAFALFRLIAVYLLLEDVQEVTNAMAELENMYPENSVGGEFTTLARILLTEIESGSTHQEACQMVTNVIIDRFQELDLHIGYWGYLNISYDSNTICPFI